MMTGTQLAQLMERLDLSAAQVSAKTKYTRQYIAKLVAGGKEPIPDVAVPAILAALRHYARAGTELYLELTQETELA